MAKRWTKTDLKSLCGAINSFYLKNRPLSSCSLLVDWEGFATKFRSFMSDPEKRQAVVIAGIQEMQAIFHNRAEENAKTAQHAQDHPAVWGKGTQEIIDRFRGLELESRKAEEKSKALVARIQADSLPQEVLDYDATQRRP